MLPHLFDGDKVTHSERWGGPGWSSWQDRNEPKYNVAYYSKDGGDVAISLTTEKGTKVYEANHKADKGINYFEYDLTVADAQADALKAELGEEKAKLVKTADNGKQYLAPGIYTITILQGANTATRKLNVEEPKKRTERKG